MLNSSDIGIIKQIVKEFFEKTTFPVEIEILSEKEGTVPVNVKTDDPQILIGEGGQTLLEIQHMIKAMLRKRISEQFYINIDINSYKKKKLEYLKDIVLSAADEVSLTKKTKELAPMPAYERRIVHMELAERQDVITESLGQEPSRRIVIKPKP